jgi:hypothetical protein
MKIILVALSAVALASAFPQAPIYAQGPPPGQPYIQIPIRGCRDLASSLREAPRAEGSGATTGSSGSIASGSGTENTTFANA